MKKVLLVFGTRPEAIKMAPFDRYLTLDVIRAVCASPRRDEIALYTGNDDNIVLDLLTTYEFEVEGKKELSMMIGYLQKSRGALDRMQDEGLLVKEIKKLILNQKYSIT